MGKSYLQTRYSGRELPDERPLYLDPKKWEAITRHLRERESYEVIAAGSGVKEAAIRERCNDALARLRRFGDLRKPISVDAARLDAVIAHYNDVMRVVGDSPLHIPMKHDDVAWMIDTLIALGR